MPVLSVYSTNGKGRREITVQGRSAMRPYGAIQIINNVGQRQEGDWDAIKAAIAAGDVVICLSGFEADVLPMHMPGKLAFGGNVRFEARRKPSWKFIEDGPFCSFESPEFTCVHCREGFATAFYLGGHMQRDHRELAQRSTQAADQAAAAG